jgi:hypothetical protein
MIRTILVPTDFSESATEATEAVVRHAPCSVLVVPQAKVRSEQGGASALSVGERGSRCTAREGETCCIPS